MHMVGARATKYRLVSKKYPVGPLPLPLRVCFGEALGEHKALVVGKAGFQMATVRDPTNLMGLP